MQPLSPGRVWILFQVDGPAVMLLGMEGTATSGDVTQVFRYVICGERKVEKEGKRSPQFLPWTGL